MSSTVETLLFVAFALAFAIKVPLFPLHTWLPDAHVEAPTGGSFILAGVMLKMGTYGFLRFVLPFFPNATAKYARLMIALGVIGIVYGALVSWVQPDMKKLVAYSSVSHLGFCVLGIFALNQTSIEGSILQMVNHGLSTGALFILAAIYLLWLVQRVFYGPITNEENRHIPDIAWNEVAAMAPLIVLMVWIGLYPNVFLRKMSPSVQRLLSTVQKDHGRMMYAYRG